MSSVPADTLDRLLVQAAELDPLRPVLAVVGAPTLDAGELLRRVAAAAAHLASRGVGPGDRIALWGQNSTAWAVWFLAAAWRGAATVAVHPGVTAEELVVALRHGRPCWLVMDERARGRWLGAVLDASESLTSTGTSLRGKTTMPGGDGAPDLLAVLEGDATIPAVPADADAPVALIFTSGSSGRPKLVVLTQRAILANARATAQAAGIGATDRIASPLPLHHSAGLSSGLVLALATGALWCSSARFNAATTLAQIREQGCTVLQGVPTMFKAVMDAAQDASPALTTPTLRLGFVGGAPCPSDLPRLAHAALGIDRLCVVYGQTEFAPTISMASIDAPAGVLGSGSVGAALANVDLRIADTLTNGSRPPGAAGEIQVRGPSCMAGYFDDEAATAAAFAPGGWLRTGDLGRLDGAVLVVEGRLKQIIIRGGENVSPGEVEAVLREDPTVADVCVVAVPSRHWGEAVCAVVAAARGIDEAELRRVCERRLASYKRPDYYVTVDSLPLLASGKVDRRAVEATLAGREWA